MSAEVIGEAKVLIEADFENFDESVQRQLVSAARRAGAAAEKELKASGKRAGAGFTEGVNKAASSTKTLDAIRNSIEKLETTAKRAGDTQVDAAEKVRVAQAALAKVQRTTDRITIDGIEKHLAAENRLAKAQRDAARVADVATATAKALTAARGKLAEESSRAGEDAGKALAVGLRRGASAGAGRAGNDAGGFFATAFKNAAGRAIGKGLFTSLLVSAGGLAAALSPIPTLLGGGAAAVVALAAALSLASGAAISLVGVLGSLGLAAGALKVGFSGVGDAVKAQSAAQAELAATGKISEATQKKLDASLKGLAPSAAAVVKQLGAMAPLWKAVTRNVQGALFTGVAQSLGQLGNRFLPILNQQLTRTATTLSTTAQGFARFLNTSTRAGQINSIFTGLNGILKSLLAPLTSVAGGFLDIFQKSLPFAQGLADTISRLATNFGTFLSESAASGAFTTFMTNATAVASTLFRLLGNIGSIIGTVFSAGAATGGNLLTVLANLAGAAASFLKSAEGQSALASFFGLAAQAGQILVGTLNTIKPLLAGIGNLFSALEGPITTLGAALQGAFGSLATTLGAALSQLAPILAGLVTALAPVVTALGAGLSQVIAALAPAIGQIVSAITPLAAVLTQVLAAVAPLVAQLVSGLAPVLAQIAGAVVQVLAAVLPLAAALLGALVPAFLAIVNALTPLIPIIVQIVTTLASALMPVIAALTPVLTVLVGVVVSLLGAILPVVASIVSALLPAFVALIAAVLPILTAIQPLIVLIGQLATFLVGLLAPALIRTAGILAVVITVLAKLIGAIVAVGIRIVTFVAQGIAAFVRFSAGVISSVTGFVSGVQSRISGMVARVAGILTGLIAKGLSIFARFNAAVLSVLGKLAGLAVSAAKGVVTGIIQAFSTLSQLGGKLLGYGRDAIQGLINGLTAGLGKVRDIAGQIAGAVSGPVGKLLKIGSPSKLLTQYGRWAGEGLENGLLSRLPSVARAARTLANAIPSAVIPAVNKLGTALEGVGKQLPAAIQKRLSSVVAVSKRALASVQAASGALDTRLKAAQANLQNLLNKSRELSASVSSAILQTGNIAQGQGVQTFTDIVSRLKNAVAQAKQFSATITALSKAGLNKTSLQQIIDAGPEAGAAAGQAVLAAGKAGVNQINTLQAQLAKAANRAAHAAAAAIFGEGVQLARGIVAGLTRQKAALDAQMLRLANILVNRVLTVLRGVKLKSGGTLTIPGFTHGGVVSKDSLIRAGEGGRKEAIVPLTRPRDRDRVMAQTGLDKVGQSSKSRTVEVPIHVAGNVVDYAALTTHIEKVLTRFGLVPKLGIVTSGGAL